MDAEVGGSSDDDHYYSVPMSETSPYAASVYNAPLYPEPRYHGAAYCGPSSAIHRTTGRRLVQLWLWSVERNRTFILRSCFAALLLVLLVLLISYWPYLDMYWLRPQWQRLEAGWRSFQGDEEHLAKEDAMAARTEFYKRRLLRLPGTCEALHNGGHSRVRSQLIARAACLSLI